MEHGKPHFIVVAAEEAPLSAEAFHEPYIHQTHPVRRLRTDPNQWLVSNQCE